MADIAQAIPPEPLGAVWTGVDLHLHSPGVSTFRFPGSGDASSASAKKRYARMYADALVSAGIRVGGITDYNGIRAEWFSAIRDAGAETGIQILPGAELSFSAGRSGLHVLVVFDGDHDIGEINRFINSLDRDPGHLLFEGRETRDINPRGNPAEALVELRDRFECLLIYPHPGAASGLCKSLQLKDAADMVLQTRPDAIEHCSAGTLEALRSTHVLPTIYWDRLAQVEFSDPKSIDAIGAKSVDGRPRRTWMKLSTFDVQALRLALHDPQVRIRTVEPRSRGYSRLVGMTVEGSGFLGNFSVGFSPELTSLIGGRGVGKSAVLETLRYALGIEPYSEEPNRMELVRNALGSGGRVSVFVDRFVEGKKGETYRVDRVLGERPRVAEQGGRAIEVRPSDLLGPGATPAIFGQREIYAVATSDAYRLRLLDELIGDAAVSSERELAQSIESLDRNARDLLDLTRRASRREEFEQRLRTVENEVGMYEKLGVAEKLRAATTLHTQGQFLDRCSSIVAGLAGAATSNTDALVTQLDALLRAAPPQGPAADVLSQGRQVVIDLRTAVVAAGDEVRTAIDTAAGSLMRLTEAFLEIAKPIDEQVSHLKRELHSETVDPDRLMALTQEKNSLLPLLEELDRLGAEIQKRRDVRTQLLQRLRDSRLTAHRVRREAADRMNKQLSGAVRLEVSFKGQKADFVKRLGALLRGSGVTADAVERLAAPEATDGATLAENIRDGAGSVRSHYQVTAGMADRIVSWFVADENRLFQLEAEQVADTVTVSLRVAPEEYRPLEKLSVGQRSTAILLLLLGQVDRSLVLDQPEDDLDNRFIYDDIVQLLREQKGQRQLVVATHNANIPVLGDAELIVPLEVREGRASVQRAASLDDQSVRNSVKQVMEGGEEAFLRRAEKYGATV